MITHCISLPNTTAIGFQSRGRNILCCSKEPGDIPPVEIIFSPVSKEGKGHRETSSKKGLDEEGDEGDG